MKHLISSIGALLLLVVGMVYAQHEITNEFIKTLPAETRLSALQERQQMPLSANAAAWRQFAAQTGEWMVEWNPVTGNPHRAYGGNYKLAGFQAPSAAAVDIAARQFLAEHADMLKLEVQQLQLRRADNILNKWYVSYHQVKNNFPVLFSEVELRLSSNGNVLMFGSDFHPDIDIATTPALSSQTALEIASRNLKVVESITPVELYILPIENNDRISYHLAYRCETITANPEGRWVSYVDAHSGEVLWRFNRVRHAVEGKVSGDVHRDNAIDAPTNHPFPNLKLTLGTQSIFTNAAGEFRFDNLGTDITMMVNLEGNFARVIRADGSRASLSLTVQNGQNLNIIWDASNSQASERDAYFHTNIAHAFIKSIDPDFTGVDYSMPVQVNINSTCNAFWNGTGINFYRAGNNCRNTAEIPTVVYHEYGHGINDMQYIGTGLRDGLVNGAMHEGLADINAALLVDDPVIGRGFMVNGNGGIRNVKNTNRYPEQVSGEVHSDGLILAGALWDLREALGPEIARRYSHFARYGAPDDPDFLRACNEYFIELIIVDDNDSNLANLTPNFAAINQAFSQHGIGSAALLRITHQERDDAAAGESDYLVQANVSTAAFIGVDPNGVALNYSTDGRNFQAAPMSWASGAMFEARLPRQLPGTMVTYYITAKDNAGSALTLPANAPQGQLFSFLVGFRSRDLHDFEAAKNWKAGDVTDDATTGKWERADPNGTKAGSIQVQPEDDHSPVGSFCFVTGNASAGSAQGVNDIDNGKTTLYSPILDLTLYQNPVIRYFRWYTNSTGDSPGLDEWEVHISNDSGKTWVEVERTRESDNSWRKISVFPKKLLPLSKMMQLRFVAQDQPPGSIVEAAVDDFEILDVESTTAINTPAEAPLPHELRLYANYPNPFRIGKTLATAIHYDLPHAASVRVQIYDITGRVVRVLHEGRQNAGVHALMWTGADAAGNVASTGFYFVVLEAESRRLTQKILVMK